MPFKDIMSNLGDAIAGVDRVGAYHTGEMNRYAKDSAEAQAEAAMAEAMQKRAQAEQEEMQKEARQRFGAAAAVPNWDPGGANIGDLVLGDLGSNYSGAMSGRNTGQQYNQRATVGTPAGTELGDQIVTEDMRSAAADALSPASMIASQRPRAPGAPQIIADPSDPNQQVLIPGGGGDPITVNTPSGPQPARPVSRPRAPGAGGVTDTSQARNIADLMRRGVPEETAIQVVYNERPDPAQDYLRILNSTRLRYATDEEAEAAAVDAVESIYGPGALEQAQQPLIAPGDDELPQGSTLIGHTAAGAEVYQTPDGRRLVLE